MAAVVTRERHPRRAGPVLHVCTPPLRASKPRSLHAACLASRVARRLDLSVPRALVCARTPAWTQLHTRRMQAHTRTHVLVCTQCISPPFFHPRPPTRVLVVATSLAIRGATAAATAVTLTAGEGRARLAARRRQVVRYQTTGAPHGSAACRAAGWPGCGQSGAEACQIQQGGVIIPCTPTPKRTLTRPIAPLHPACDALDNPTGAATGAAAAATVRRRPPRAAGARALSAGRARTRSRGLTPTPARRAAERARRVGLAAGRRRMPAEARPQQAARARGCRACWQGGGGCLVRSGGVGASYAQWRTA
jgi:hypothetical protein